MQTWEGRSGPGCEAVDGTQWARASVEGRGGSEEKLEARGVFIRMAL